LAHRKRIVEEEQYGKNRAEYGKEILKHLSAELQGEFGEGFAERCLREYRQFYLTFKNTKLGTQCMPNRTWSHIKLIIRLTDKNAMQYYLPNPPQTTGLSELWTGIFLLMESWSYGVVKS
jgi:hypothetical protein